MNTYNKHPEAREGEVCLGFVNIYTFKEINWKTKRLGKKIQSLQEDIYPVFVSEEEIEKSGVFGGGENEQ
ncbi:MAG: hypothetical protein ACOCVY_03335 [Patescibacteria group bacterium]